MTKARFSVVEVKRAVEALRAVGLPVENMAFRVDVHGFSFLPAGAGNASDEADLDAELKEFRKAHAHG